jgi:hypothetical protein
MRNVEMIKRYPVKEREIMAAMSAEVLPKPAHTAITMEKSSPTINIVNHHGHRRFS